MDYRKIIDKLEHDLSHYLISELTRKDPTKRQSYELYKYKGLSITADPKSKEHDKTIHVRIGVFEAEFKAENGDICSGSLDPVEERLISLWLSKSENLALVRRIFSENEVRRELSIIPFELDDVFDKSTSE